VAEKPARIAQQISKTCDILRLQGIDALARCNTGEAHG